LNGEDDRGGATSQPSSPSTDTAALKPTGAETGAELERRINDLLPTRWEHEDETRWFLGNIGRSAKRVAAQSDTDEKALQKLSLAELGKKFEESGSPRKWNESAFRYSQMLTSGAASKSKASDEKSKASDEKLSFLSVARGLLAVGEIANPELRPARILLEDCMRPYWENPKSAKEFFSRSSTCWLATKEDLRADDARPQTWWQSNGAIELPAPESITSETWIAFVVSRSVRGWILEARVNEKFSMLFVGDIDEDATSTSYPTPHGTWQEPGIDMLQTLQGWKFFMKRLPTSALRRATSGRGKGGTTVKIQIQWIRHPASPASDAPSIWHVALLQPSL